MDRFNIKTLYPDLLEVAQIEEAIAEAFADAVAKKKAPSNSFIVHAFNKIARLLRAIRQVFGGAGYTTPEAIFGATIAGEISRRQYQAASRRERPVVARLTGEEIPRNPNMRDMGRAAQKW